MSYKASKDFAKSIAELIINDPQLYQHTFDAPNATALQDALLDLLDDNMKVNPSHAQLVYRLIGAGVYFIDWEEVLVLVRN